MTSRTDNDSTSTSVLRCNNPFCPRRKPFLNIGAYSSHLATSPTCRTHVETQTTVYPERKRKSYDRNTVDDEPIATEAGIENNIASETPAPKRHPAPMPAYSEDATAEALDPFFDNRKKKAQHKDAMFSVTQHRKWLTALMVLLDDLNMPDGALPKILTWSRAAYVDGFNFDPPCSSRKGNLKEVYGMMHNTKCMLPYTIPVQISDTSSKDVIVYDFVSQLLSKLQNKEMMQQHNLLIDLNDPLKKYKPPDGLLGDCLSGSAYSEMYDHEITDPLTQLFIPLIFWIDKTHIT